jgi:hypothetical protein
MIQQGELVQLAMVRTNETDGDSYGNEWLLHYVVYHTVDDDSRECYDIYADDGEGNGTQVARGYNRSDVISIVLRLGDLVEWSRGVPLRTGREGDDSARQG